MFLSFEPIYSINFLNRDNLDMSKHILLRKKNAQAFIYFAINLIKSLNNGYKTRHLLY